MKRSRKKKSAPARKKKTKILKKWFITPTAIFFISILIIIGAFFIYNQAYSQKIFWGVRVGKTNLGGMNFLEALESLETQIDEINKGGLKFIYQNHEVVVEPTIISTEIDASYDILTFDSTETINQAYLWGRNQNLLHNLKDQLKALILGNKVELNYYLDEEELKKILEENFRKFETPAQNAQLIINQNHQVDVLPEKEGEIFDYPALVQKTKENIENLTNESISLSLITDYPTIKANQTQLALAQIQEIINLAPLTLTFQDKEWEVSQEEMKKWLQFQESHSQIGIGFGGNDLKSFLEKIAQDINIEAQEGKFQMENNKVVQFQASQDGRQLEINQSIDKLNKEIIKQRNKKAELVIVDVKPKVALEDINNLGIQELIGRGESNFTGSPRNRIHNIKTGAETLNGLLIKPEEEFSLIKALGKVDQSTGYLPELVIKGNKTIPEYGGGLCQIGTTTFRVALDAGVPITERQNHSYRVSYYEPAGTDATIYDPKPDFKFINDTGHYILFQTKIEGYKLIFEFYGTADGRKVAMTQPRIFNFKAPGPTKIVETEDLGPGEKKCTERAHTGADTEFTRTITHPNGERTEEVWKSHYKPWQEVCLVGKEKEG